MKAGESPITGGRYREVRQCDWNQTACAWESIAAAVNVRRALLKIWCRLDSPLCSMLRMFELTAARLLRRMPSFVPLNCQPTKIGRVEELSDIRAAGVLRAGCLAMNAHRSPKWKFCRERPSSPLLCKGVGAMLVSQTEFSKLTMTP